MFDTHCHLAYEGMDSEKAIENAKKAGLTGIIMCAYPRDLQNSMKILEKHRGFVYLSFGLHPVDIADLSDREIEEYLNFVRKNRERAVAIGECGLDYHWYKERGSEQDKRFLKFFEKCIELAKELKLPLVLHTRKAEQECFDIIIKYGVKKAVFHCYSGNLTLAKQIIDSGFYISLATNLLGSKNTKKIAKNFPLDRLLTETDSPFLSPVPGKKNEPANVKMVVEEIAKLRGISFEEADRQIVENVRKFFSIDL